MHRFHFGYFRYLGLIVLGALAAINPAGASIVPTAVSFDPPFHGYGTYTDSQQSIANNVIACCTADGQIYPTTEVIGHAELSASLQPDRIGIVGAATAGDYFTFDFWTHIGWAADSGTINFDTDKSEAFIVSWQTGGGAFWVPSLTLKDTQGQVFLNCIYNQGCATTPAPLFLPKGSYVMDFGVGTDHGPGAALSSTLTFSLTEVPLPPGIWLMLSGAGLVGVRAFFGASRESVPAPVC